MGDYNGSMREKNSYVLWASMVGGMVLGSNGKQRDWQGDDGYGGVGWLGYDGHGCFDS